VFDCGGTNFDVNSDGFCDEWVDLTVTDVDGNSYETVQIGAQLWFKENLKLTKYNDNSDITTGLTSSADEGYTNDGTWSIATEGAFAVYPIDDDEASQATCGDDCADIYGNLYNWYTVDDERGVCPEGWHVSLHSDWATLVAYLDEDAPYPPSSNEAAYQLVSSRELQCSLPETN
jgi:uncharacterized protein (TIGR02145 family)